MKYIVIQAKLKNSTIEIPFIFPNMLVHSDIADAMRCNLNLNHSIRNTTIVSAGDLSFLGGRLTCSGKSDTLNVESRQIDKQLIQTFDYTHGLC